MDTINRIEELRSYCKKKSIPLTQQRLEIFKMLIGSKDHPSPEEIHLRLRKSFPSLSLATVYKNLEALSRIGFARKINPLSDHARYDFDLEPHSHFICLTCKMIEDIHSPALEALNIPNIESFEHKITAKTIQYFGICKQCQSHT